MGVLCWVLMDAAFAKIHNLSDTAIKDISGVVLLKATLLAQLVFIVLLVFSMLWG